MERYFYSNTIQDFQSQSDKEIIGQISINSPFADDPNQKNAWLEEIRILKSVLSDLNGTIFMEYSIPRMGRRIDVVLIIKNILFILEFKIGEKEFSSYAIDQVWDYALDLKNFHETSHEIFIAPILIATNAINQLNENPYTISLDNLLFPLKSNDRESKVLILDILNSFAGSNIDSNNWSNGRYNPTPTIIEAAMSLYNSHTVADISRNDAEATNLSITSETISKIIQDSKENKEKAICFVTGVPGAGKTLVGLDIATKQISEEKKNKSIFLSGNGPLVLILREALTRDKLIRENQIGNKVKKGKIFSGVKSFIQNVHEYRDEYLIDESAPYDHVAIFDEAQRAWTKEKASVFMKTRKKVVGFNKSEPEFLISCLDRHKNWAVIICLVGGGQEIHSGEAGISEWINALNNFFPKWKVYISNKLTDSEYATGEQLNLLEKHKNIVKKEELHLSVSLRSFRAENLSTLVKNIIDIDIPSAKENYNKLKENYPIVISRNLSNAKTWLRDKARGSERYGIVVSSQAYRLKPHAIDVRVDVNPIHWFLNGKDDVRSSYFLEDVATEFHIQGLELDWTCVTWDADLRFENNYWKHYSFKGKKWENIRTKERKQYQKNAYRVLLTRARQGMIIVVPKGDENDDTRKPEYYNGVFNYLKEVGLSEI